MQRPKDYCLSISLRKIRGRSIEARRTYSIKLDHKSHKKALQGGKSQIGSVTFNKTIEFHILGRQIDRNSKLIIQLIDETDNQELFLGKMELFIMDFKNYSQKQYKMQDREGSSVTLEMNMTFSSTLKINSLPKKIGSQQTTYLGLLSASPQCHQSLMNASKSPNSRKTSSKSSEGCNMMLSESLLKSCEAVREESNNQHYSTFNINESQAMFVSSKAIKDQPPFFKLFQENVKKLSMLNQNAKKDMKSTSNSESTIIDIFHGFKNKFLKIHQQEDELEEKEIIEDINVSHYTSRLHICHGFDFTILPFISQERSSKKRYQLIKNITSENCNQQVNDSNKNISNDEKQLNRIQYIKLSKITQFSKNADIAKLRNASLTKANQELQNALKEANKKLQIAKKIIRQKDLLLQEEFGKLREHLQIVNKNLSLKKDQFAQKEVRKQRMNEQYLRDINKLKNDLKESHQYIRSMKAAMASKDESDSKQTSEVMQSQIDQSRKSLGGTSVQKCKIDLTPRTTIRKISIEEVQKKSMTSYKSREKSEIQLFRKFSHSKNASYDINDSNPTRNAPKSSTDLIFDKIAMLFTAEPGKRLLQNL